MHVLHVVGARPNFMKVAPVCTAFRRRGGVRQTLVHTGQHYDRAMSEVFLEELGVGEPDRLTLDMAAALTLVFAVLRVVRHTHYIFHSL